VSYTLRGRLETRLAAVLLTLFAAVGLAFAVDSWWPLELAAVMAGVGLAADVAVYDRLLDYQPGWLALPLGAAELGVVIGVARLAGIMAPLGPALALFGLGWLAAQVLGHAVLPLVRMSYATDGGELGRAGPAAAVAVAAVFAGAVGTAYAVRPPTIHLSAGVHQGPLVITRREVLVGEPGATVRGGIVVKANGVTIRNVAVVGGGNGIEINGYRDTVLDGVSVSGAKLDGIHVRLGGVMIKNCRVDMLGNPFGQGIDISYNMDMGMSMVEGCTIVGGMNGIVTHSSMTDVMHNDVSRTTGRAIGVTEMSMGMVSHNTVTNALGMAIYCGDRSECEIEHNVVSRTRDDSASGDLARRGYAIVAWWDSDATIHSNTLVENPRGLGAFASARFIRR
jgi:parallel beta helix pectate lyase-like protein